MPHRLHLVLYLLSVLPGDAAAAEPVKAGYGEVFPFCYTGEDGRAAGFMIEVFEEAARREGFGIEWVRSGETDANTKALVEGSLDLLPMGHANRERRAKLHVSAPWWYLEMVLIARAGALDAKHPRSLALTTSAFDAAAQGYPQAIKKPVASARAAAEAVCRGDVGAAFIAAVFLRELLLGHPPACREVPLQVLDSSVEIQYSVLSAPAAKSVADGLRKQINAMATDGTLPMIAARHPPVSAPHAIRMAETMRTSYERDRLRILSIATFVIACLAAAFVVRQRFTIRKQRLAERELIENRKVLEERTQDLLRSNEDLQSFAYSVSHDLQEPLRNQQLYSELLERRCKNRLPAEGQEYLQVIRNSATRMNEMMASLLVYSRIGHSQRPKAAIDCGEVVRSVLHDLELLISSTAATVEVGPMPEVVAWQDRLNQVFQNLIENAIKYRKPGTQPVVKVACRDVGGHWLFSVSDNGIGFKPEYAHKIFGVFKRLHAGDMYGGSGIGLAVSKRIIERHGGSIWAESREGEGSTFYFTLPQAREGASQGRRPDAAAAGYAD